MHLINTAKVISALLIGTVLGILFAPDKGRRTRRKVLSNLLVNKEDKLSDEMDEKFDEFLKRFRQELEQAKLAD
jgi:gas vesicle protein